jgi:hypothetical protein
MGMCEGILEGLDETPTQPAIEPLWSFPRDGRTISCILRYHGKQYGVEASSQRWRLANRATVRHDAVGGAGASRNGGRILS